eukprot:TRINITY_DN5542_c0_g3_i1.p1 TRINITY_DN5542_c0_g3~~TRINITY_DN5542_c0_g3_i1.p1  ORF type:complete len:505 (+),score=151.15 TRINITY_DN5542_c0_g3_i1:666-2180(+)
MGYDSGARQLYVGTSSGMLEAHSVAPLLARAAATGAGRGARGGLRKVAQATVKPWVRSEHGGCAITQLVVLEGQGVAAASERCVTVWSTALHICGRLTSFHAPLVDAPKAESNPHDIGGARHYHLPPPRSLGSSARASSAAPSEGYGIRACIDSVASSPARLQQGPYATPAELDLAWSGSSLSLGSQEMQWCLETPPPPAPPTAHGAEAAPPGQASLAAAYRRFLCAAVITRAKQLRARLAAADVAAVLDFAGHAVFLSKFHRSRQQRQRLRRRPKPLQERRASTDRGGGASVHTLYRHGGDVPPPPRRPASAGKRRWVPKPPRGDDVSASSCASFGSSVRLDYEFVAPEDLSLQKALPAFVGQLQCETAAAEHLHAVMAKVPTTDRRTGWSHPTPPPPPPPPFAPSPLSPAMKRKRASSRVVRAAHELIPSAARQVEGAPRPEKRQPRPPSPRGGGRAPRIAYDPSGLVSIPGAAAMRDAPARVWDRQLGAPGGLALATPQRR